MQYHKTLYLENLLEEVVSMNNIHKNCIKYGTESDGYINYVKGANVAGFIKVAKGMMGQGIV